MHTESSHYCVIPARVMDDRDLRPSAILLYGRISSLCNDKGYCWAENDYLARLSGLNKKTVSELIGTLAQRGHVEVEVIRNLSTNEVDERRIWVDTYYRTRADKLLDSPDTPPPEIRDTPSPENPERYTENSGEVSPNSGIPLPENREVYKVDKSNVNKTPIVPKWGAELFAIFWRTYPRKVKKPAAERAWKKLKPDADLLNIMLAALYVQMRSREWTKDGGAYIPHPSTWLNNRQWEDAPPADVPTSMADTASAKEVLPEWT